MGEREAVPNTRTHELDPWEVGPLSEYTHLR